MYSGIKSMCELTTAPLYPSPKFRGKKIIVNIKLNKQKKEKVNFFFFFLKGIILAKEMFYD